MRKQITVIEGDKSYTYKLVEDTTKDAIEQMFTRRTGIGIRDLSVEKRTSGYRIEFYINSNCDIFQSEDTLKLIELGYFVELIHPYDNDHYVMWLRDLP